MSKRIEIHMIFFRNCLEKSRHKVVTSHKTTEIESSIIPLNTYN
jgi:hypothetical protein